MGRILEVRRWPWQRAEVVVELDHVPGTDLGFLLTTKPPGILSDAGVIVSSVDVPELSGIVCVGDELVSVDGNRTHNYAQARHWLTKPGSHKCRIYRKRGPLEEKKDEECGRWVRWTLLAVLGYLCYRHADLRGWAARNGIVSLALPGGGWEPGWDRELVVLSIGSSKRTELQRAQQLTIGCHARLLRYDESVAPCHDCSLVPSDGYDWTGAWSPGSRVWNEWKLTDRTDAFLSSQGGASSSALYGFGGSSPFSPLTSAASSTGTATDTATATGSLGSLGSFLPTGSNFSAWWRSALGRVLDVLPGPFHRIVLSNPGSLRRKEGATPASLRSNATQDWWCAQQRLLAALADALRSQPEYDWTLIVDDDTYVNVRGLRRLLRTLEPETPAYIGDRSAGFKFVYGGGGHLLSRGLLRGLRGGIRTCLDRSRFEWCEWHSDWVLPKCLEYLNLLSPDSLRDGHPLFQQDCVKASDFKSALPLAFVAEARTRMDNRSAVFSQQRLRCAKEQSASMRAARSRRAPPKAAAAHAAALMPNATSSKPSRLLPRCRGHHRANFSMLTCHGVTPHQMVALHRVSCF
jgi:hypothetical protein